MDINADWGLPWDSNNTNDTQAVNISVIYGYG
jgi:hypothetical protein